MKKLLLFIFVIFLLCNSSQSVYAAHLYSENFYQKQWCDKWGGKLEYKLKDNTRVDCLTKTYAVEFDFASKWAEGYGQAVHYSDMTGKKPVVILIIEKPYDWRHYKRLKEMGDKHGVEVWYVKSPVYGKTTPTSRKDYQRLFSYYIQDMMKQLGVK